MAAMLWVLYFLYVYRSVLQGLGDTLMPMVSGMAEFVMRISAALIFPILSDRTVFSLQRLQHGAEPL